MLASISYDVPNNGLFVLEVECDYKRILYTLSGIRLIRVIIALYDFFLTKKNQFIKDLSNQRLEHQQYMKVYLLSR